MHDLTDDDRARLAKELREMADAASERQEAGLATMIRREEEGISVDPVRASVEMVVYGQLFDNLVALRRAASVIDKLAEQSSGDPEETRGELAESVAMAIAEAGDAVLAWEQMPEKIGNRTRRQGEKLRADTRGHCRDLAHAALAAIPDSHFPGSSGDQGLPGGS